MNIARNVLRYLKHTVHYELTFVKSNDEPRILGYSDSDFASSANRRSISGYCFQLNSKSALISWKTRKQSLVADSTCESEYVALSEAAKEAVFLRQYFAELKMHLENQSLSM